MQFTSQLPADTAPVINLFQETFTASEGAASGAQIGAFVTELLTTSEEDLLLVTAAESQLLGAITFSRLTYPEDTRTAFIMSPVAVSTAEQSKGIGQKLITYGLEQLRARHVDHVFTYGDPNYYGKTGFQQITEDFAQAPLPLSFPHGWLAQPLGPQDGPFKGPSACVPALNNPELW